MDRKTYSFGDFALEFPTEEDKINEQDIDQDTLRELRARINRLLINESPEEMQKRVQNNRKLVGKYNKLAKKVVQHIRCIQYATREVNKRIDKMEAAPKKSAALVADILEHTEKFCADMRSITLLEGPIDEMKEACKKRVALVADMQKRTDTFRVHLQLMDLKLKERIDTTKSDIRFIEWLKVGIKEFLDKMEAIRKITIDKVALLVDMQERTKKIRTEYHLRDAKVQRCIDRAQATLERYELIA
ncbi:hypothetical protein KR026_008934 [Drosophila bipectinata]|nr:hypothetical protein KR026_008934 [Drosophila bipectinata]